MFASRDWTKVDAYKGPLRYTQLELLKMFGFSAEYALELFCPEGLWNDED